MLLIAGVDLYLYYHLSMAMPAKSYFDIPENERFNRWMDAAHACDNDFAKQYEYALKCYRQALAIRPHQAQVWSAMGKIYMRPEMLDWRKAQTCFEKAYQIAPADAAALEGLALCAKHLEKSSSGKSAQFYVRAMEAAASDYKAFNRIMHSMLKDPKCDYDYAINYCFKVVNENPSWKGVWATMALLAELKSGKLGYKEKEKSQLDALAYIDRAIALHPERESYRNMKARLLSKLKLTQSHLKNPQPYKPDRNL